MSASDSEDMHNYDDNHTSAPAETHSSFTHTINPTTTNNARNIKETEQTDENFNSFHYWRSPLPDISGELEMLSCQTSEEVTEKGEKEEEEEPEHSCPDSKPSHGKATSDQIQKVLDCLQPHMDDPDVQGECAEWGSSWFPFDHLTLRPVYWSVHV